MIDCFVLIKYPTKKGELRGTDFKMKFDGCKCNGEEQILELLKCAGKLLIVDENNIENTRKRIERDLFINNINTKKIISTQWSSIKESAAINTNFQFIKNSMIENLKRKFINDDNWREEDGYIKVGPFKNYTRVGYIPKDGFIEIFTEYCDDPEIHYTVGNEIPTLNSPILIDTIIKITKENLKLNFICKDKSGNNEIGDITIINGKPKIIIDTTIKNYKQYVSAKCDIKDMPIYYTSDGSNVENSNLLYNGEIEIPIKGFVLVQGRYNDIYTNKEKADWVK